ncbi:MAG: hypothetical protein MJ072_04820, partial [Clostridia bacterium]|nr:hypothetical protein [Clostridia bacterium]
MKKNVLALAVIFAVTFCIPLFSACSSENDGHRTSYVIDVTYDDVAHTLSGNERVTFFNTQDVTLDVLEFNVYGNAFRKDAKVSPVSPQFESNAYPMGKSYGENFVSEVTVNGGTVEYYVDGYDKNVLFVPLGFELFPEESCVVDITFSMKLSHSLTRTGYNDRTVNIGNFYPIACVRDDDGFKECVYYPTGDPFYSDVADYSVKLTLPDGYAVASSGQLVDAVHNGGRVTLDYRLENARDFALVLSPGGDEISGKVGNTEVRYVFYNDDRAEETFATITEALSTFSRLFCDYPYKTYTVVEAGFYQGGMEYPC